MDKIWAVCEMPWMADDELKWSDVEKFVMFIGHPRSGHSLIGSLLDAHPDVVIAHEFDALQYVKDGIGKKRLLRELIHASAQFTAEGRQWEGYDYRVPNQWCGRYRQLKVLGDKKGGHASLLIKEEPELVDRLAKLIGHEPYFIHVIRNPFDNIATMFAKGRVEIEVIIDRFFDRCETIADFRKKTPARRWLDLRHEGFVANPKERLADLLAFLDLTADAQYFTDCASIVFPSARQTRGTVEWSSAQRAAVEQGIARFDFLAGYTFEK